MTTYRFRITVILLCTQVFAFGQEAQFLFSFNRGNPDFLDPPIRESFVYATDDSDEISFMREALQNGSWGYWTWRFGISTEPRPYNRNFEVPGQPLWNWSFKNAQPFDGRILTIDPTKPDIVFSLIPFNEDPAAWVAMNGSSIWVFSAKLREEITGLGFSPLINISSRSEIVGDKGVAIAGFFIPDGLPKTLLIRGMGPAMIGKVENPLDDPKLRLFNHNAKLIASNDDWETDQSLENFELLPDFLLPHSEKEAALIVTLGPSLYTAHLLSAIEGDSGTALIEVYDVTSLD